MKLDRRTSPQTYTDFRPLRREQLVEAEQRETWRLWMLLISFGGIIVSSIIAAVAS